jgi:biopolymer transport protein ExbB
MKGSIKWLVLALAIVPTLAPAASWWNKDWKYRKEISFDLSPAAADIAGTVQDVPVLVRLSLANFSYFADTKPDGSDFRLVASDDKTPLKFHFEKYDPQNQMALLWVRVPQITGGSKTEKIYAYYGDPDSPAAGDVAGTYDASQVLVLSFSDGATPADLTAYKNNPTASTATLTPASLIAGGAKFSGKETITVPATPSLRLLPAQGITASAWVRVEQAQQAVILALNDAGKELTLGIDGDKFVARAVLGGAPAVTQGPAFSLSQWHHVALSAGSGKLTLFVDGAAVGSAPVNLSELGGKFTIGSDDGRQFFSGDLDEVEVSKAVRPADWIKAAARGQGIDANLIVYGADGQKEAGGQTSYFATIAKNLTVDGWVVIGICLGMLVVALLIMVLKALFLTRVEKGNARFLREFQRLSGDPAALDKPSGDAEGDEFEDEAPSMASLRGDKNEFGASTLYRLYHSGVREMNKRVAGKSVGARRATVLSPQSIDAIRAAMDASMTRLQQTISSQMVLLTIAISGGPFLGLLGTVIGVMITFAAIALSGDVNVNAIAPGIAAALAATIAGLAVAIPALFGYNWLNSRIKNISADNRVFVDEFVTRVAEQYS